LIRENARLASSCDWLAQEVSAMRHERAILLDRILEVQVPVMTIARDSEERATSRPPDTLTPELLSQMSARYAAAPDAARGTVFRPTQETPIPAAEAEAAAAMAIFEDAGDARADKMGAAWDQDGELVFLR